jgi:hypothetical protein
MSTSQPFSYAGAHDRVHFSVSLSYTRVGSDGEGAEGVLPFKEVG